MSDPINDGGQWDMAVNLVTKYGMLPKKCFPETFSCESRYYCIAFKLGCLARMDEKIKICHYVFLSLSLFNFSSRLNNILKSKLREYARSLRLAIDKGNTDNELRVQIAGMMAEVYRWVIPSQFT